MFVKIGVDYGDNTVQDMLNVMDDDFFIWANVSNMKSFKDCNELVKDNMCVQM